MNSPLDRLTKDELIVLFEWLSTNEENENVTFSDISELAVLDRIHGILEKELAEPFSSDWGDLQKTAGGNPAAWRNPRSRT